MANAEHRADDRVTSVPRARRVQRRAGERFVGSFFRVATRFGGMRPSLLPTHMRRQMHAIGIDDDQIASALARIRTLADWPYAWEAEGDWHASNGDWGKATSAYVLAQRILLTDSPLKRRIYNLACEAYARVDQPALEHLRVATPTGGTIAAYLQFPTDAPPARPGGLVLVVPGVTVTKEELHYVAAPLLRRGWAVARIDNPGYGQTTGKLVPGAERNPATMVHHLAGDPRIDHSNIHLVGFSLGGNFALHSCLHCDVRTVTSIASPFHPEPYFFSLPSMNHTALQHMTGVADLAELASLADTLSLRETAPRIHLPVQLFHGGRDRTIPASEASLLAEALAGEVSLQVWERDHHNCIEHLSDIVAGTLEFIARHT